MRVAGEYKAVLMGGIGEGVSEACQEGLPGHEQGSVMFSSTVGVQA